MTDQKTDQSSQTDPADPWAPMAATWDTDPAVLAYAGGAFGALQALRPLTADLRVLDFGCGTGLLTERIAPLVGSVVAVDASPAMIAVLAAKGLPRVEAFAAQWAPDAQASGPGAGPFDLIVCSSVCAFLPDYPGMVRMLARRLAPGGQFVQWDWELDPSAAEPYGLSRDAMRAALTGAGLRAVSVEVGFDIPMGEMRMRPLMGVGTR